MPSVILLRHAQASFGGENYDVLSDLGRRQVVAVADDLKRRGVRIDRVVSGTLQRQRDTAEPFGEPVVDARWNEYTTQDVLGHHSDVEASEERTELSSRDFQTILERALHGWIDAGDEGPAGEPFPAFVRRAEEALAEVTASLGSGETALVSTSGGVIGALCTRLLGVPPRAFVAFNRVTINTGLTKITHGRSGTTLVSFNEHSHLDPDLLTYR